jgi:hypothetical protein
LRAAPRALLGQILGMTLVLAGAGCTSREALFSDTSNIAARVIAEFDASSETVDLAIYTFLQVWDTDQDTTDRRAIHQALADAASVRGVAVRGCADAGQTATLSEQGQLLDDLADAGVQVRVASGYTSVPAIMHDKYAVIDGRTLMTGSFNYTYSATYLNDENVLILTDPALAADYGTAFEALWSRCEDR